MTTTIDHEIDRQHAEAQAAEDQALQVLQRMRKVDGIGHLVDRLPRKFGQVPNPYAGKPNLTIIGTLERRDPALAQWLAKQAGTNVAPPDYAAKAQAEARAAAAERMKAATEATREQNRSAALHRERSAIANVSPLTGRRLV